MACGMHQGVVWCQTDLFWLAVLGLFFGTVWVLSLLVARQSGKMTALSYTLKQLARAYEEVRKGDEQSPSDDGPTTETAAQKLHGDETCIAEGKYGRCIKKAGHDGPHKTSSVYGDPDTWGHDE